MAKHLISIDGGGTKTEFCISDLNGNIIKSYFTGSTNYKSVGIEEVYSNFKFGFSSIMKDQKLSMEDIAYIVFGISGCDSQRDYNILYEQIKRLNIPKEKFYLCNDGLLAFYAQAEEPGIVVISGTGSIVLGVNRKNKVKRAGGWGYHFSDIGSGYWIGNELLKRTLLYCDNIYRESQLFKDVRDYFQAKNFEDLPYKITEIVKYDDIAKISRLVTENTIKDEWLTRDILNEGATYLSNLVKTIYKSFEFEKEDKIKIVFSGGVLKSPLYREILEKNISHGLSKDNFIFVEQINTPAFGGIKLAKMGYKGEIDGI